MTTAQHRLLALQDAAIQQAEGVLQIPCHQGGRRADKASSAIWELTEAIRESMNHLEVSLSSPRDDAQELADEALAAGAGRVAKVRERMRRLL